MASVGLDIGNGFVKCFSDGLSISFPSLFVKNNDSQWDGKKSKNLVGYDAVNIADDPGVNTIKPSISGDILDSHGYGEFVLKSLNTVQKNTPISEIHIVSGIPFSSKHLKEKILKFFNNMGAKKCTVLPQAYGTLYEYGGTGSVINIGHGTVEMMICKNHRIISGQSLNAGIMNITKNLDCSDAGYTRNNFLDNIDEKMLKIAVSDTASYIANKYRQMMMGFNEDKLIISGGGILFHGMENALKKARVGKFTIPENPAMSNARGLFQYGINRE